MRSTHSFPVRLSVVAVVMVTLTPVAQVRAQNDPRLLEALRIAQEGASDSARAIVNSLLRDVPATDTLYPQLLYTMGLVSRSVEEMRRNYSRVALEYTTSPWADDALYRLALLDYAAGNFAGVTRQLDRIRNDYPESPLLPAASEWAARSLFDLKKPQDACAWLALGLQQAAVEVELKNRLDYLNGRCTALPPGTPPRADSGAPPAPVTPVPAPTPAAPPAAPAESSAVRSGFGVQVGAVNNQGAADKLAATLKAAGYLPYIAREGGLFKVRVGPYPDRPRALAAAEQIRRKLGHSPFVVKEP